MDIVLVITKEIEIPLSYYDRLIGVLPVFATMEDAEEIITSLYQENNKLLKPAQFGVMEIGKVSESVFSGDKHVIPMSDVMFMERDKRKGFEDGISVILRGTTWNSEIDTYNNCAYLRGEEAKRFMKCWGMYRAELETDDI